MSGTDFYKIGYSKNEEIDFRIKSIQTGCPTKLEKIASCPGEKFMEKEYHDLLAKYRGEGEWFKLDEAIVEDLLEHHGLWSIEYKKLKEQQTKSVDILPEMDILPKKELENNIIVSDNSPERNLNIEENKFYKIGEIAEIFQLSRSATYRLAENGLKIIRFGGGAIRVLGKDLKNYILDCRTKQEFHS